MVTPGSMRQSPEQVRQLTTKANGGDVRAMHTLAAHHITAGEKAESRHWLAEAARHGDCHAVQNLIENSYSEVTAEELPHWRSEARRLGCDPHKNYVDEIGKPRSSGK